MVKLTQVDENTVNQVNKDTPKDEKTYEESESESDSDVEDDFDESETLLERIAALKEIVPPKQRRQIYALGKTATSTFNTGLTKGGNILWTLTSSALLLGVPLSLAILAETQLQEMEKDISLQQSAQDVLAGNEQEKKEN